MRHLLWGIVPMFVSSLAIAQSWSVNEFHLLGGTSYRQPNNPQDLTKTILTYQHVSNHDGLKHFGFVDLQWTDHERFVTGTWGHTREFYGEYYAHLALNHIGFQKLKRLNLVAGINVGNKYSDLNQRTRAYLLGASYDLKLDLGSFNFMLAAFDDHSRSRFGAPHYQTSYQFTPSGVLPLTSSLSLSGYVDFNGSKGAGTAPQMGSQIQLRYDLGSLIGQPARAFLGIELQYFRNKFGVKGLTERVPQVLLVWKI